MKSLAIITSALAITAATFVMSSCNREEGETRRERREERKEERREERNAAQQQGRQGQTYQGSY